MIFNLVQITRHSPFGMIMNINRIETHFVMCVLCTLAESRIDVRHKMSPDAWNVGIHAIYI